MPESVNAYRYLSFLLSRWRFIAISCAIATGLSLAVSLTLPNKYTATCRILIEPPAGTDIRSALAVSPIYLEALKTYEHFATSDNLFLRALDQFHLRQRFPETPIESLKTSILKVAMVPDTRILEIKVTMPDPKTAQALALYLGEQTIQLNQTVDQEGDRELVRGIEKQESDARLRLEQTEAAWTAETTQKPIEQLQQDVASGSDLKTSLERQLLRAELDAADPQSADASSARAAVQVLRKQIADAERDVTAKEALLAKRLADRDRLDAERSAAQTAYTAIQARLNQVRGDLGYRGERLKIIDRGIVPERPSSPNIPLNVLAALLLGLIAPIVYMTLELSLQAQRGSARRSALRLAGAGRDE
jgi:uncharacterized protein involved in exopolysaccharide biosynthesis